MNSESDDFEQDLGRRVTRYVASADLRTQADVVVGATAGPGRAARTWLRPLPIVAVALVLVIASPGLANVLLSGSASSIPHATVAGVTYDVVVDRTLTVKPGQLSPYAPISVSDYAWAFSEQQAYSLQGVNPRALLVVPAKPGAGDESWGDYLILLGPLDPYPSACGYYDARLGEIPAECAGG